MDRYESLGVVGEGSYGIVLKCRHRETGQIVAIKKFLESDEDQNVKKIALREVRMLKRLRHENLVNLIEFFRRKRRLYLVFEYVDHTVLDELEACDSGLDPIIARSHIFQVIRGISYCHENQVVHRDVKPENILVSRLGVVKLCDFGFARTLEGTNETCTDYVATRWYRAPELLVGDTKYGREVDIWAIGCLLTEILSGEPLFPGESDIDQLFHIIQTLGELSSSHKRLVNKNPMLSGLQMPVAASTPLTVTFPKWPTKTLTFISECLYLTPSKRPTAEGLLHHEYFTHDSFPEKFLPDLQKKVQEEFCSNVLLQSSQERRTSGKNEKKTRKKISGSPQLQGLKCLSRMQAAARSPKKLLTQTIQQELSIPNNNAFPSTQLQPPSGSQNHSMPLSHFLQQSPNHRHQTQSFAQQNMNSSRNFINYSFVGNGSGNKFPFEETPVNFPFSQIPPIKETQAINNDTLNNFPPFLHEEQPNLSGSNFHATRSSAMLNLHLISSPSRTVRKEEKSKKTPQMIWPSGLRSVNHHYLPTFLEAQKDPSTALSMLVPLSPFCKHHQFDSGRHPYAVSLDRTKESPTKDLSARDPLREIKDNNKETKKDSLFVHNAKETSVRKPKKETSGWAKPKLLNDELYLPHVPRGKSMVYSPNKGPRTELSSLEGSQKWNLRERKNSRSLMPLLSEHQRGSASSSDSLETIRPGSTLPYV